MRFTTWSTLTNAFIISTVALLSLIQAVNAFDPELFIMSPNGFEPPLVPGDLMTIRWSVYNNTELPGFNTMADIWLRNDYFDYEYLFGSVTVYDQNITIIGYLEHSVVPPLRSQNDTDSQIQTLTPSATYYIQFVTWFGRFNSDHFTIGYK